MLKAVDICYLKPFQRVRDLGAAELGGFGAEFHEVEVT